MSKLQKTFDLLIAALEIVGGLLLIAMLFATAIGVADRFIFRAGLPWPGEAARYLLVWASFISAVLATASHRHYLVDLFLSVLPSDRARKFLRKLTDIVSILVIGVFLVYAMRLILLVSGQRSPALGLPMLYVYAALPVCAALMLLIMAIQLLPGEKK